MAKKEPGLEEGAEKYLVKGLGNKTFSTGFGKTLLKKDNEIEEDYRPAIYTGTSEYTLNTKFDRDVQDRMRLI